MKITKKQVAKRILLNRYTVGLSRKLQRFLNANIPKSAFTRQRAQIATLRKKKRASDAKIDTLRGRVSGTQRALEATQGRVRQAQASLQTMQGRVQNTQKSLQATQGRMQKTQQEVSETRARLGDMRKRLQDTQDRTRQMQTRVQTLSAELAGAIPAKTFLDEMVQGASYEHALLCAVRDASGQADRVVIRALCFQLFSQPQTRPFGALLLGIFMVRDQMYPAAFRYFQDADEASVLNLAPHDYFGSWMGCDAQAGKQALLAYVDTHSATLPAARASQLCELLAKYRFYADVADLMGRVPALLAPPSETDPETLQKIAWVQARLAAAQSLPPQIAEDQINLAIMDYKLLDRDRTSSNRGDYVQTLAALTNICRFENVTFAGDTELGDLMETLKADVHPDRRLQSPAATVVPVALDRDYASGRRYLPDTWLICNGWFMHRHFRGTLDFPFPPEINPIFLSFHINDPDVLTADIVEELRKYEPIGCRDWTTVYRLRDYGVSCFFSGCLTTTIGQGLPKAEALPAGRLAAVETRVDPEAHKDWEVTELSQIGDYVRDFSLVEGICDAKDMLTSYLAYSKIATSRLHCYLPCRSMGFAVDFKPRNRSDIRFEGLLDLNDTDFDAIRSNIETKLETILGAIFAGQSKDAVMTLWREICAPDVAAAEAYYTAEAAPPPVTDIAPALHSITRQTPRPLHKDAVELAFALDQNLANYLPATLQSVVDHTPGPVNVHLITRGLDQTYLTTLAQAFPEIAFQMLDFSAVDYGKTLRLLSHTTEATLDRLYLPEILPDVPKILYLDIDLLVRGDLRRLFDIDLGDNVLAGKFSSVSLWQNVVRLMTLASLKLPPQAAWEMRRRLHRHMTAPARTFNAGVIVMNLAQMRAEAFTATYLHLVTDSYCNDQDVLNIYAAGRVTKIDPTWNAAPAHDYDADPQIVHWAGRSKPWDPGHYALWQPEFDAAMKAAHQRMQTVISDQDKLA